VKGNQEIIQALRELVEALDRRVPQVSRTSEVSIARDAAALRRKALARIDELEASRAPSGLARVRVPRRSNVTT
jgi:hypothetical protein